MCLPAEHNTTQTACIYMCTYYTRTVESGIGNCMSSARAVESGVRFNAVQPSDH